jgi:uncharacterized protein YecT (DUF1311 family)
MLTWAKLGRRLRKFESTISTGVAMKLVTTSALVLLILCATIVSQNQKEKDPCADAQSQAEMNMCWGKEYKAADTRLNKTYQDFMSKLDESEKAQLKSAQLAWLKYRDANCDFVADQYKGGTMRPMIAAICLADVTNNRTTELKAQMKEREQ